MDPWNLLATTLEAWGIPCSDESLVAMRHFYALLLEGNKTANLTRITGEEEAVVKHFLDSLSVLRVVPEADRSVPRRILDVGAGAGFPGIPLKLVFPELELTLVDSVGKKTAFMSHLVDRLGLTGVEVIQGRSEELGHRRDLRESFDWALARGLARMPALLEYTLPFCKQGGKVVAWKHGGIQDELFSATRALRTLGGRYLATHPVTLAGLTDNRIVVVVEKVGPTPAEYSRRAGVPAKQPI